MNWKQDRLGYYFDFFFSPALATGAAVGAITPTNDVVPFLYLVALGFVAWTFVEYWVHRLLFHRFFCAEHDLHHNQPGAYDALPPWMTTPLHLFLCGALFACAGSAGLGVFSGMELGYFLYIWTHDQIHHGRDHVGWLRRRWEHHRLHHQGTEANFGVAVYWWDRLFGTYVDPQKGT